MRPRPSFVLPILLTVIVAAVLTPVVRACPPGPVGLVALIEGAEQAVVVEIVDVRYTTRTVVEQLAREIRESAVDVSGIVSADLAWALEEFLPELELGADVALAVRARVLAHLDPDGPRVGRSFTWVMDAWDAWDVRPGRRAVVFLDRRSPPLSWLGLAPSGFPDSVLVLADHQQPSELTRLIEDGFADKHAGTLANVDWLTAAVQSPTARLYTAPHSFMNGLPPDVVADALVATPTGTSLDVHLLGGLAELPRADLDQLAVDLVEAWLDADEPVYRYSAGQAVVVALERWQVPVSESLKADLRQADGDELRALWHDLQQLHALPAGGDPYLRSQVEAWQRTIASR